MRSLFGSAFFHVFVVIVVVAVDAAAAVVSSFIYSPVCMSVHVALALYTTPFIHTPYVLHVYYTYSLTCLLACSVSLSFLILSVRSKILAVCASALSQ